MNSIVTIAELQKNTAQITKAGTNGSVVITSRGKGRNVLLPYFDGNQDFVEDYLEAHEMNQNKEKLQKELKAAQESGLSDLVL